jgi:hypothetical protein
LVLALSPLGMPSLAMLRAISLAVSGVTMLFLWIAARAVSSPAGAWLAVAAVFAMAHRELSERPDCRCRRS